MSELPEFLKSGEEARLIPVGSNTQRERAACSVLLASLRVIRPFARELFAHLNWRVGNWAEIEGFTEPVFKNQPNGLNCRPDGLLILNTGKNQRRAIVEAKIGNARIDADQLAQYWRMAKANRIDAIVTVSNELTAYPTHLPYAIPKELKGAPIFHCSWAYLVMLAELLRHKEENLDEEQDYLLAEIIRYFDHENTGINSTMSMCAEWSEIVDRVQHDIPLNESDAAVWNVVRCWHQQLASVCINRTRHLKDEVSLRLPRSHWNQDTRLEDDVAEFVLSNRLSAAFDFSLPAGPIEVIADAQRRTVSCRICVDAPLNRQSYKARVRWLLNQLPDEVEIPARVDILWEKGHRSSAPLSSLREDLNVAWIDSPSAPRAFEIVCVRDLATRFAGVRTLIPELDEALTDFYEEIAEHVYPWEDRSAAKEEPAIQPELTEPEHIIGSQPQVIQSGEIRGRAYSIFDDGTVEIETGLGVQRFGSFAELTAAAAAKNGHAVAANEMAGAVETPPRQSPSPPG